MPRLTRSVFLDLAIWMAGFGLLIGCVFPPFVLLLGVSTSIAISAPFVAACVGAGLLVGGVNWVLARLVVGSRLHVLADRMELVAGNVRDATYTGDWLDCEADRCRVTVDSADEIGRSSHSFNELIDALTRSHDVEAAVSRFAETLAAELDINLLSHSALDQVLAVSGAGAGAVLIEADGEITVRASYGLQAPGSLALNEHVRLALQSKAVRVIDTPPDVFVDALLTSFRPRQILVVPIAFKSVVLAVLVLAAPAEFRTDERRLVELLRPTFGLAVNNAMAHEHLQRLAALDPLTDLYNRRFGLSRLREEFARAVRASTPLGVIMLDLDGFKQVNDAYGHVVGDRVLRAATRSCRHVLREGDILVRYGGDEFLAILPGASRADVGEAAERLRRIVADTIVAEGEQSVSITLSAGAASMPEDNVGGETALVERADSCLYRAKELGRNQVVVSGDRAEQGRARRRIGA